jgi:hypothetical protein
MENEAACRCMCILVGVWVYSEIRSLWTRNSKAKPGFEGCWWESARGSMWIGIVLSICDLLLLPPLLSDTRDLQGYEFRECSTSPISHVISIPQRNLSQKSRCAGPVSLPCDHAQPSDLAKLPRNNAMAS